MRTAGDDGRGAAWMDRLMRIGVPFGIAILVWNAWLATQLATGAEPVRPLLVLQLIFQVGLGIVLLVQAAVWFRERPRR